MPRAKTSRVSRAVLMAWFLGFAMGDLPDNGPVWLGIKALAAVTAFVLALRLARQEADRAS